MKTALSTRRSGSGHRLRRAAWTAFGFIGLTVPSIADDFAALVSDRTAVERVYYNHRLGTKPPFEQTLPPAEVERLVKTDLLKEALLAKAYHVDVTSVQVAAEVKRIAQETRAPDMLAEVKAALCNDPDRFARAVAKPIIVHRELHRRFEYDDRLHGGRRKQLEAAREKILAAQRKENPSAAVLNAMQDCVEGTISDFAWQLEPTPESDRLPNRSTAVAGPVTVKAGSRTYSLDATVQVAQSLSRLEPPNEPVDKSRFQNLSPELRNVLRAQLQKPGDVSAVIEAPDGFLLFAVREKTDKALSVAVLAVPKISFEQWLSGQNE